MTNKQIKKNSTLDIHAQKFEFYFPISIHYTKKQKPAFIRYTLDKSTIDIFKFKDKTDNNTCLEEFKTYLINEVRVRINKKGHLTDIFLHQNSLFTLEEVLNSKNVIKISYQAIDKDTTDDVLSYSVQVELFSINKYPERAEITYLTVPDTAASIDIDQLTIVQGSGNIFKDFDIENPEVEQIKSQLTTKIRNELDRLDFADKEAAEFTGFKKSDFSKITNMELSEFTIDKLINILKALNENIEIDI